MSRVEAAIGAVRSALDGRRLVWFGIRGEDGEALLQLPELEASYSIIAPLRSGRIDCGSNVALEASTGVRPDLDRFDIDLERDASTAEFRRRLLREVSGRCVLMTYRPSALVSAFAFSMADTMSLAGPWKDRHSPFEHKPWVERSLRRTRRARSDWQYVADEHRSRAKRMLAAGPLILRASRTSGGVGIVCVSNEDEVDRFWPAQPEMYVGVAPFLDPTIPINFSGFVFADGSVRLHPPSLQLIGIPSCVDRRFGYCGNDFGAIKRLSADLLRQIDEMGRAVATWLHEERYLGVFGVDALIHRDQVHFVEVNARFQGSSATSAQIAAALDLPDLFLDHLAATLGGSPPADGLSIIDWARHQPSCSQIVAHNTCDTSVVRTATQPLPAPPRRTQLAQLAAEGVRVAQGGVLCRVSVPRSVTTTGFELDIETETFVETMRAAFAAA